MSQPPFMVGEVIPGYCCGQFSIDTIGSDLRVEAVGIDWLVLRDVSNGNTTFYAGSHEDLRRDVEYTYQDRASGY